MRHRGFYYPDHPSTPPPLASANQRLNPSPCHLRLSGHNICVFPISLVTKQAGLAKIKLLQSNSTNFPPEFSDIRSRYGMGLNINLFITLLSTYDEQKLFEFFDISIDKLLTISTSIFRRLICSEITVGNFTRHHRMPALLLFSSSFSFFSFLSSKEKKVKESHEPARVDSPTTVNQIQSHSQFSIDIISFSFPQRLLPTTDTKFPPPHFHFSSQLSTRAVTSEWRSANVSFPLTQVSSSSD